MICYYALNNDFIMLLMFEKTIYIHRSQYQYDYWSYVIVFQGIINKSAGMIKNQLGIGCWILHYIRVYI